ncbi:hypothetical protein BGX21_000951 [Mortierella sp. AD011]|nr:hypothetical protein BGX20_007961 [Mortierella sp. AD010]KAF9385873.1 hypothetical protein BGX21_000951 [Mortierella sp. AD011]
MTSQKITLFCILDGDSSAFDVKLDPEDSIAALKRVIKEEQSPLFDDIRASDIRLFQIAVPDEGIQVNLDNIVSPTPLTKGAAEISEVFGTAPPKKTIHVIFQRPPANQEHPLVNPLHRPAPTTVCDETRLDNKSKQPRHSEEEENEALKTILAWRMETFERWVSRKPFRVGSETWMMPDNVAEQLSQKFSQVRTAKAVAAIAYSCGWLPFEGSAQFDELAQVLDKFNNEIDARRGSVSQTTAAFASSQLEDDSDGDRK